MSNKRELDKSTGRAAYSAFARRYAAIAPTRPHNALYERPATMALLGDVTGQSVLDAGCGPGICSELLARNGASVQAFDVTPEMVELARDRCAGLHVEFAEGDLSAPLSWLPDRTFDKVLCSLALDYVVDLAPVFAEFQRVARVGGTLIFSMSHPMSDWMDARKRGLGTYFETVKYGIYWNGFGEPKPYVQAYRRPLSDILNALSDSGWVLDRFIEPLPLESMRDVSPGLHDELSLSPAFMCVRAHS
jgi:2-polyprenyl-6-hydroxyphenyl methylase/3-demethylubiquinone-9 3-methyltransferase